MFLSSQVQTDQWKPPVENHRVYVVQDKRITQIKHLSPIVSYLCKNIKF